MRFQIGRIDHNGGRLHHIGGQSLEYSGEHPHFAPTIPAVVECLGRAVFLRCIAPAQSTAIDNDSPAENTTIIDSWAAMALGEEGLEPCHLLVAQPEKIAHHTLP